MLTHRAIVLIQLVFVLSCSWPLALADQCHDKLRKDNPDDHTDIYAAVYSSTSKGNCGNNTQRLYKKDVKIGRTLSTFQHNNILVVSDKVKCETFSKLSNFTLVKVVKSGLTQKPTGDIDFEHVACQTPDRFLSIASCKDSTIGGLYTSEPKLNGEDACKPQLPFTHLDGCRMMYFNNQKVVRIQVPRRRQCSIAWKLPNEKKVGVNFVVNGVYPLFLDDQPRIFAVACSYEKENVCPISEIFNYSRSEGCEAGEAGGKGFTGIVKELFENLWQKLNLAVENSGLKTLLIVLAP